MKIRLAKLVDISNISTLYRTLFQTMAELQIEYYRKADQDVDFLKSVINSDTKDILVAEEDEQIIGFVLVQQLDTPPYACIVPHRYMNLLTSGKLHSYLAEVDKQAEDMFLRLVKEYADRQDVTEQLKKDNPYEWIGRMNNIQACVREVVGTELIYT